MRAARSEKVLKMCSILDTARNNATQKVVHFFIDKYGTLLFLNAVFLLVRSRHPLSPKLYTPPPPTIIEVDFRKIKPRAPSHFSAFLLSVIGYNKYSQGSKKRAACKKLRLSSSKSPFNLRHGTLLPHLITRNDTRPLASIAKLSF